MAHRFGPQGETVEAFLDEVCRTDVTGWQAFAERARSSDAVVAATVALTEVPLPASVGAAVDSAQQRAFAGLGLTKEDFPRPRQLSRIHAGIEGAVVALALGDRLAPEHRRALLEPFAAAGFRSVQGALGATGD